jgi:diguanylate cyclase (GGDEF)-like protein/PAS domain S-box-containing protein
MAGPKKTSLRSTRHPNHFDGAFQLVFSQSPVPMWIYDPKSSQIIEVNDALVALTGYSHSDFKDLTIGDLFHTNEIPLLVANLKKTPDQSFLLGARNLRTRGGDLISVTLTAQLLESNEEPPFILLLANRVVKPNTEIISIPSNQLMPAVLENLRGINIFSLDTQYRYIAFTSSHTEVMKTLWGTNIEIGMNILDCIPVEDDRARAKNNFDRVLRGEYITLEEEYGSLDHHRAWWDNRYSPVYDLNHNVIGLTVFVIDITQRKQVENALRASEYNYRSIMDQASDGIFIASPDGKYVDVNQAACEMLGYSRDELLSLSIQDMLVISATFPLRLNELLEGKTLLREIELMRKDGTRFLAEVSAKMLDDGRLQAITRDITIRKKEEKQIRYQAFVLSNISSAVITTGKDLRITQWNKAAEDLYGWKESEVIGHYIDEICHTEFLGGQQIEAQKSLQMEGKWQGELRQRHRSGRELWVSVHVTLLDDEQGNFIGGVTINHDITERRGAEDELRRAKESIEEINEGLKRAFEHEQIASRTDILTGIYNRRYFFEFMEYQFSMSKRYNQPVSIILFDVDNFKQINDTYGHLAGDDVLISVAQNVKQELRESDVFARFGGDEFIILVANNSAEAVRNLVERIREKLESLTILANGHEIKVTISAGIADLQPDIDSSTKLVNRTDQALYQAKQGGRNRVMFSTVDRL